MRAGAMAKPISLSEAKQFQGWFNAADEDNDGRVNGQEAVEFFGRSGLSKKELAKVWVLADQKRQGSLNLKNFALALWLIGNAQNGLDVTVEEALDEKIAPRLEGVNDGDVDDPPNWACVPCPRWRPGRGVWGSHSPA